MAPNPERFEELAKEREDENWEFRAFLRGHCSLSDEGLDELVATITKRVWSEIDCCSCARCCNTLTPCTAEDELRLMNRLGLSLEDLRRRYIRPDPEEKGWVLVGPPCTFLDGKKCSVYEARPEACRRFPFLYEKDFRFRLVSMVGRSLTCPIVLEVLEELKRHLRWHAPRRRERF